MARAAGALGQNSVVRRSELVLPGGVAESKHTSGSRGKRRTQTNGTCCALRSAAGASLSEVWVDTWIGDRVNPRGRKHSLPS